MCISLVEVYRFGQCLGWRFLPISTFVSLVSSRALRDAPHSRFLCLDFNLCLLDFLKVLDLTLSQIYKRLFNIGSLLLSTMIGLEILANLYLAFSRVFSRV